MAQTKTPLRHGASAKEPASASQRWRKPRQERWNLIRNPPTDRKTQHELEDRAMEFIALGASLEC